MTSRIRPPARHTSWLTTRILVILVVAVAIIAVLVGMLIGLQSTERTAGAPVEAATSPIPSQSSSASSTPSHRADEGPTTGPTPTSLPDPSTADFARRLDSGPWKTSHVQGIAVDRTKGFIYYSFTTLLVKTDLDGKTIGTVDGFTGHLGDIAFNPADGKVYGSLEYKDAQAFYVAVFDVDDIDHKGIHAQNSSVLSTVYLPEVVADFTADLNGDGAFAGDTADTADHRYGCSGIDGIAFGPEFGRSGGRQLLTVAYGIYSNDRRSDNDYQVLVQYDSSDWASVARPLTEANPHHEASPQGGSKYFVYTGNTHYGVQTLDYDGWQRRWLLASYAGSKPDFPNYTLFAVDAESKPEKKALKGQSGERGATLPLADAGLKDAATGIRGWKSDGAFGLESLGDGLYYVARSTSSGGSSSAELVLESWTGDAEGPFEPVN